MAAPAPARAGGWPWPSWALPFWWLLGAARVVTEGFKPSPYLTHVAGIPPAQQPYDVASVAFTVGFMAIEAGLLMLILRPARYPGQAWGRAAGALGLAVVLGLLMALTAMHAPPSALAGIFWALATVPLVAVLVVVLEIRALRAR